MELDGREAAASSLEPKSCAIAEPDWLWEAIAAAESPVSAETEDAGDDTNGGPDAGNEQKGGGPEAPTGDDPREDSGLEGIGGEFAKLRHMIQESAERTENEAFGKLDRMEEQTKTLAEAVAANAAAMREFAGAEGAATRSRRNRGTAEGRKPDFHGRLPSLGRCAARVSPSVVGACARRCCSGLLSARRIGRVAVRDCSPARSERRLEPPHLGQLRPCHRRLCDGSKAGGPRGEVFVRRS